MRSRHFFAGFAHSSVVFAGCVDIAVTEHIGDQIDVSCFLIKIGSEGTA